MPNVRASDLNASIQVDLLRRLCWIIVAVGAPFGVIHYAEAEYTQTALVGGTVAVAGLVLLIATRWGVPRFLVWSFTAAIVVLAAITAKYDATAIISWLYPLIIAFFFIQSPAGAVTTGALLLGVTLPSIYSVLEPVSFARTTVTLGLTVILSASLGQVFASRGQRLYRLATEDPLTGLGNRRGLIAALSDVDYLRGDEVKAAILIIDADHFKCVNDRHGHAVGDDVLRSLAQRIRNCCRQSDLLFRYGGEEFVLIAKDADVAGAAALAEKVRARVNERPIIESCNVTVSIGVAEITGRTPATDALTLADAALYKAKAEGRNRVELAGS